MYHFEDDDCDVLVLRRYLVGTRIVPHGGFKLHASFAIGEYGGKLLLFHACCSGFLLDSRWIAG